MASDESDRRQARENSRLAEEDLPPKLEKFIYGKPDELPELPDPPQNGRDPFIHGGRVGTGDDESHRQEESSVATADGEHHPAVKEFISGDPDELPELGEPPGDEWDPFIHGGRVGMEDDGE